MIRAILSAMMALLVMAGSSYADVSENYRYKEAALTFMNTLRKNLTNSEWSFNGSYEIKFAPRCSSTIYVNLKMVFNQNAFNTIGGNSAIEGYSSGSMRVSDPSYRGSNPDAERRCERRYSREAGSFDWSAALLFTTSYTGSDGEGWKVTYNLFRIEPEGEKIHYSFDVYDGGNKLRLLTDDTAQFLRESNKKCLDR